MNHKLIVLFFITSFFALNLSCDTNDTSKEISIAVYTSSLDTWNNLKATNENSYTYTISTGSVFGFGSNTIITIKNGSVTSRVYESYSIYDSDNNYVGYDNRVILTSYTEDETTLNNNTSGAEPVTIDELYNTCLSDYLSVNADSNLIEFNVNDSNIIKDCYYVPNGCQDDCTYGIQISSFQWSKVETN